MDSSIRLTAGDGHRLDAYLAQPQGACRGGLVVVQEIFGVNSHIRSVADGFAADGYRCIAPALFDRAERGVELGYAPADVERGRALRGACPDELALLDIAAAIAHLADAGCVGVVGYCWGGTLAWLSACRLDGISAAVAYYGGGLAPHAAAQPRCPVMAHFGERDSGIPLSAVEAFRAAQPDVPVHLYPAGHGFNCDQRSAFEPGSAALARERTLQLLGRCIG